MPASDAHDLRRATDQRLARLEGVLEGIFDRFSTLEQKIDSLAKSRLLDTKTNWSPIIAGVAVVVALVGILATGYARDQTRMETAFRSDLQRIALQQAEHLQTAREHMTDGHPRWVNEKVENVKEQLRQLREEHVDLTRVVYEHNEQDARETATILERCK